MKITDVTLRLFEWLAPGGVQYGPYNPGISNRSHLGLVTIFTDEGLQGHAFLGSAARTAELDAGSLISTLKPLLIGEDPTQREYLFRKLSKRSRSTTIRCIGAIDVALWDIAGKAANLPIYKLVGGFRDKVPAYASSAILESPGAYADEALAIMQGGWKAYKIHPPCEWRTDIAVCEAVRRSVGDSYCVMLDSVWAYDYPQALRVGHAIEELDYYWYEDPLPPDDIYNYVKLKQNLHIPIAATEHASGGLNGYATWLQHSATDYLRGDVAVKGGITPCLKTAHLAEAFGLSYEIHHGGNSLNNVANLHLMCGIGNSELFEVLLPAPAHKYGLVEDLEIDADGMIAAPTGPGLGVAIDFEFIERKTTSILS